MKKLIGLIGFIVGLMFLFTGLAFADPYEKRQHEWTDKNEFTQKLIMKSGGELQVKSGAELQVKSGGSLILEAGSELLTEDGTAAGAGLSPLIWSDLPRLQILVDPTTGHFIGDDFAFTSTESYTTAKDYVLAGANGTFAATAADPNGVALISAPGTDNDESNVNHGINPGALKLDATTDWWFEARVKISQITTAQGIFVGLITDDITMGTDFHTDDTMVMKVQDSLGFQILAATDIAAVWQTEMTLTGGARVAVNATLLTASTGFVKLGMKCVSGTITFYVNGVADATTTTSAATNYPLDQYVVPAFATKAGTGVANNLSVDWWYIAQLR